MTLAEIARLRLRNQLLEGTQVEEPTDVVRFLGAVQAQDFPAARWAVTQRTARLTSADFDRAFGKGDILRTHVLRPTWHFVTPADIRWMLRLTANRITRLTRYYHRTLELDDALLTRTSRILARALRGGTQLTRAEIVSTLKKAGVNVGSPVRLGHILLRAELDGVMCSGAPRGAQQTYALLDDRAPPAAITRREEARAELARRYFAGHGPATLKDFTWWSGLSAVDATAGLEDAKSYLVSDAVDDQVFWFTATAGAPGGKRHSVHVLPNYDEYIVAYADRSAVIDASIVRKVDERNNILFNHAIVVNGVIRGVWKRIMKGRAATLEVRLFVPLSAAEEKTLQKEARRYADHLGLPVEVVVKHLTGKRTARRPA